MTLYVDAPGSNMLRRLASSVKASTGHHRRLCSHNRVRQYGENQTVFQADFDSPPSPTRDTTEVTGQIPRF